MDHIQFVPATLAKVLLGLCTSVSGLLAVFMLTCGLSLVVRAFAMQTPYDYRQDDHMRNIDSTNQIEEAERNERRKETLAIRATDEEKLEALEKAVAAMSVPVSKVDEMHDRQIRDEAYVGGALGIIGLLQFYLSNKEKQAKLQRQVARRQHDPIEYGDDEKQG